MVKNTRCNDKEGECEQLRYVVDQKDATIAEKEQQLRQCREDNQIQQLLQHNQELQREKQTTGRAGKRSINSTKGREGETATSDPAAGRE